MRQTDRETARHEGRTVLLQVSGDGACRNCMFSVKDQMSLDAFGLSDRVAVCHLQTEHELATASASCACAPGVGARRTWSR